MKVLVTGANGFVGSHLVDALLFKGYEVKCLVRKKSDLKWLNGKKIELVYGEITQKESLPQAIKDVEYVYHTAGVVRALNAQSYYLVNQQGTYNLIDACARRDSALKKFIYISSQAAAGPSKEGVVLKETDIPNPITDYGKSKLKGEEEVLKFKEQVPFVILRPSAVYGPRDKDIYNYFKIVKKKVMPVIGSKEKYINLCYVQDLVDASILAAESNKSEGKIYFISDGNVYSWTQIGETISRIMNLKAKKIVIPEFLLSTVSFFSEAWSKIVKKPALINKQKVLEMKQKYWLCDISLIKDDFGFTPKVIFNTGAKLTVDWYYKNNWL